MPFAPIISHIKIYRYLAHNTFFLHSKNGMEYQNLLYSFKATGHFSAFSICINDATRVFIEKVFSGGKFEKLISLLKRALSCAK